MTYIAYNKMNPAEQLVFNSTGKVDEKYLLTDAEWEDELAKINCEHKIVNIKLNRRMCDENCR